MSKIVLATERLLLREMTPRDADDLALILSDAETMRFYPQPYDRQGVEDWIARNLRRYADDGHGMWAMILQGNQQFVGNCGLTIQEIDGARETEVGYLVNKAFWRQGLATEAARACLDYAFNHLGRARIISLIRPENLPSRRVAEKNGLQIEKETIWAGLLHYVYVSNRAG
jgi:RimJ/RimL family protein N-acetyltransferase